MRFIVDLYRFLILLFLAIGLISASYFAFALSFGPMADEPNKLAFVAALIVVAIAVILGLGLTATFISIHDRIAEISNNTRKLADALEASAPTKVSDA